MDIMYVRMVDELRNQPYWQRVSDKACIPNDPRNRDHQQMLADVAQFGSEIILIQES